MVETSTLGVGMVSTITRLLSAALVCVAAAGGAQAAFFAGDPVADFWTPAGNSQALGGYIRGSADFDFTMY